MKPGDDRLEVLSDLEREEARLLAWGVTEAAFDENEALDLLTEALRRKGSDLLAEDVFDDLVDHGLLVEAPDAGPRCYRTRMAETVRLITKARQWFPGRPWTTAAPLVVDYRFDLRPRQVPRRNIAAAEARDRLKPGGRRQQQGLERLLMVGEDDERSLGEFQVETADRVLRGLRGRRTGGTIVTASTGGGKTLAFYLPALAWLVDVADSPATRVLALYPRNELLKDQLVQTLREVERLRGVGRRPLRIGAYFGPTPGAVAHVERASYSRKPWAEHGTGGRVCPYIACPRCGSPVIWPDEERARGEEVLRCTRTGCGWATLPGEFALTRDTMHAKPPDLLFVSTEMLNRLASNTRARHVLGIGAATSPSLLLLDEVHTYGGTSGAHVVLLLRRWHAAVGGRVQFVGLSATLRDAVGFFAALTGLREDQIREVAPRPGDLDSVGQQYQLVLRGNPMSATALLSTTIQTLMAGARMLDAEGSPPLSGGLTGTKVFAFSDKLDIANRLFHAYSDAEGWGPYGRPEQAPLAALRASDAFDDDDERQRARAAGQVWDVPERLGHSVATDRIGVGITTSQRAGVEDKQVIVATASLEVGYNDDRVGMVLQHKAPRDPAAFLQRRGRAGRRIEQRPWAIVVLSDFGRDGLAYRAYDRLFDPHLPARSLPVSNQAVLRMQAALSTLDWLAGRLGSKGSVWDDLTRPGGRRQEALAALIERTLEDARLQQSLRAHLVGALDVEPQTADHLLWAAPRPILTGLLPTALRRLRAGWDHETRGDGGDLQAQTSPLPDFIPVNLFTDLQMPEVAVEVPPQNRNAEVGRHDLPVFSAMTDFAPGNVSFRFAIEGPWAASWVQPEEGGPLQLDEVLTAWDELAPVVIDNVEHSYLRPWGIRTERRPQEVQDTSSGRLRWAGGPVAAGQGTPVEFPQDSGWSSVLTRVDVHLHANHDPAVVRRFATGYDASIAYRGGERDEFGGTFVSGDRPAVLGFEYDADAIRFNVRVPEVEIVPTSADAEGLRSFRVAWFAHLIATDARMLSATNVFQREQLERAYLAALAEVVHSTGVSAERALRQVHSGLGERLTRTIDAIFGATDADAAQQRGLVWLREAAGLDSVISALTDAAERALIGALDGDAEGWARQRFASTIAAALREALQALCPEFDVESDLVLDVVETDRDRWDVWFSETSPGGGGVVEVLQRRAADGPRRFLSLADRALQPTDFEVVDSAMTSVLEGLRDRVDPIRGAVQSFRGATSNQDRVDCLAEIREALVVMNVGAPHAVVAATAARVLRPGASPATDEAMAFLATSWAGLEEQAGIELESSAIAYALRRDAALDPLAAGFAAASEEGRLAGALSSLWLRGWRARAQSLNSGSPYAQPAPTDRLLLRRFARSAVPEVDVGDAIWPDEAHRSLAEHGIVRLRGTSAGSLARAIRRLTVEPTDTGGLLLHPVVNSVRRDGGSWLATAVMGETGVG